MDKVGSSTYVKNSFPTARILALEECRFSKERRGVHSTASHLCIPRRLICLIFRGACVLRGAVIFSALNSTLFETLPVLGYRSERAAALC